MSTKKKHAVRTLHESMETLSKALVAHMAKEESELRVVRERQEKFEKRMDETACTVKDMRDILSSFRIAAAVAKWVTAIGTALVAVYAGYDVVKEHAISFFARKA